MNNANERKKYKNEINNDIHNLIKIIESATSIYSIEKKTLLEDN